ncbi:hypothetical protein ACFE04_021696 [Oxalis oulophora]
MENFDDEYYYSDRDSLDDDGAFENDDSDDVITAIPKASSATTKMTIVSLALHLSGKEEEFLDKVITRESLLDAQKEDLRRVVELLSLREHHARTLLIHHRWNVDKVFEVLVEKGKTNLFAEAGVTVSDYNKGDGCSSPIMCEICIEEVPGDKVTRMDCGHSFCNDWKNIGAVVWVLDMQLALKCLARWTEHFIVKINEGQSRRIRCMAHKCNAICDESVVRTLVSQKDPELAEKFDRFLLESYIEDNKMVKWCPSAPHCGNAIRIEEDECCEVECSCGLQFCFSCLCEAHSPCSCMMWKYWIKKCRDESETVNWITVHTKPCPKCHKPVEKNGGCNLAVLVINICVVVAAEMPVCSSFCHSWLCGEATGRDHTWSRITGHSCGRFKDDCEQKTERAKKDLYRYMHYHNRYKAHTDSFKLESKLRETILEKVSTSEERESKLRDFSWVTDGLNRLFRSRRVLSYSYPFAFYMFGEELFKDDMTNEQRELKQLLFEDRQQQLETNVEKLSKFLEEPFDQYTDDKVMEIRMQVINLMVSIDSLCQKMYEFIENDLLDSIQFGNHRIAPYKSKGIERASESPAFWSTEVNATTNDPSNSGISGAIHGRDRLSGSGSSAESECSSRKRPRKDGYGGGGLFDLNLPAEVIDRN